MLNIIKMIKNFNHFLFKKTKNIVVFFEKDNKKILKMEFFYI